MKKTLILLIFGSYTNQICIAQPDSCKPSLSINIGIAKPLGDYAFKEYYGGTDIMGDALTGIAINLISYLPLDDSRWGFCGLLGYYQNGFDSYSYLHSYSDSYVHGTPYKLFNLMFGPYVNIGSKKIFINLHLLIGFDLLITPQLSYYESSWQQYYLSSSNALSVGIDCGAAAKWKITRKIQGILNVEFYASRITYSSKYVETPPLYNNPPYYTSAPPTTSYVPIELLNITVGVAYEL